MQHQRPMSFVPIEKGATCHATIKQMGVQEKGEEGVRQRESTYLWASNKNKQKWRLEVLLLLLLFVECKYVRGE